MSCICCWDNGDHKRGQYQSVIDDIIFRLVSMVKGSVMDRLKYRNRRDILLVIGCFIVGYIVCYFTFYKIGLPVIESNTINTTAATVSNAISDNVIPAIGGQNKLVGTLTTAISSTAAPSNQVIKSTDVSPGVHRMLALNKKFDDTIKSCLGDSCFNEKVTYPSGDKINRIGILAPLRSGGPDVLKVIKQSMANLKNNNIDVYYDTHVPAYGYGKNHGMTRIIRLANRLIPHAVTLLGNGTQISLEANIASQVKQLMRWHCRLNHVAAHTRMLTIFLDDLLERPAVEFHKMLTFIDGKFSREEMVSAIETLKSHIETDVGKELLMSGYHYLPENIATIVGDALQSEFDKTNYLTKWPCPSFKEFEQNAQLSLIHSAPMLAANCSDPFVMCSVRFDQNGGR